MPSSDNEIIKSYDLSFPIYHAISTEQTAFLPPRSTTIHDPSLLCDHLVPRLFSKAFCGIASSPSSPITEDRNIPQDFGSLFCCENINIQTGFLSGNAVLF
ncbi:MAG: hypothetical protein M3146_04580 [Thermoproteota archaeon]|nr:hypothetical protein [Thermoproteota archaeon]